MTEREALVNRLREISRDLWHNGAKPYRQDLHCPIDRAADLLAALVDPPDPVLGIARTAALGAMETTESLFPNVSNPGHNALAG
jgi:hypothetical protein